MWSDQYQRFRECCFHSEEELYQVYVRIGVPLRQGWNGSRSGAGSDGGSASAEEGG